MDALLLVDRVRQTISLGESHFREFKSALDGRPDNKLPRSEKSIRSDIAEALVSFANADGGELLIGVEDDGTISGVPHAPDQIAKIRNIGDLIQAGAQLPIQSEHQLEIDGKLILFFSVLKGTTQIYQLSDGRCVRRKDRATLPAAFHEIQFERQETRSREFDRLFVDGSSVSDLDVDLVRTLSEQVVRGQSPERYLQTLGLAEYAAGGLRLRMAALLLFAKEVQKWHPRVQVRILKVNGSELKTGDQYNVVSDEFITGNIFKLLTESWERLRGDLASRTELDSDAKFEQRFVYPELAAREALINAIAHRDYSIQNAIEVWVFRDRMEIKSPGTLLSTLTVAGLESLEGAHDSRNVLVARVLRENKYILELGEGMRRIFRLTADSDLVKPKLYSNTTSFSIILFQQAIYSQTEEAWLSLFKEFQPSRLQKRILVAGINGQPLSARQITQALNSNDRDVYDQEVTELRNAGILVEIRNNAAAAALARQKNVAKNVVERFKVLTPDDARSATPDKGKRLSPTVSFSILDSGPKIGKRPRIDSGLAIYGASNLIDEAKIREWIEPITVGAIVLAIDRVHTPRMMAFVEINDADARKMALDRMQSLMTSDPLLEGAKLRPIHQEGSLVSLRRTRLPEPGDGN